MEFVMTMTELAPKSGCTFSREWDKESRQWLYHLWDEMGRPMLGPPLCREWALDELRMRARG